jgi:hypothetical protein
MELFLIKEFPLFQKMGLYGSLSEIIETQENLQSNADVLDPGFLRDKTKISMPIH